MGIPRFASRMRSYGSVSAIGRKGEPRKDQAVVDGPSLAHSLLQQCPGDVDGSGAILPQVHYSKLGEAAVAWLDDLQSYGFSIEAIYFDGALPAHKQAVRIERLQAYVDKLAVFKSVHDDIVKVARKSHSTVSTKQAEGQIGMASRTLPPPPFLVFAVIEALESSEYAARTFVVNGEADEFCAAKAMAMSPNAASPQSTIFTNDSDLILHGLSGSARVVFINEMFWNEDERGQRLDSLEFWPFKLRTLKDATLLENLARPAYLMKLESHLSFRSAMANAQKDESPFLTDNFDNFLSAYDLTNARAYVTASSEHRSRDRSESCFLDSRVSEVLRKAEQERHRIREMEVFYATEDERFLERTRADVAKGWATSDLKFNNRIAACRAESRNGPELLAAVDCRDFAFDQKAEDLKPCDLDVFLPVIFEDTSRSSCWRVGAPVREVAMHVATMLCGIAAKVYEYKRSGQRVRGTACQQVTSELCHRYLAEWTVEWSNNLELCSKLRAKWRWRFLVARLAVVDMAADGMNLPSRDMVRSLVSGKPRHTWDLVHLDAMFQADYYSLRMLRQVLSFVAETGLIHERYRETQGRALRVLETLPSIASFCDQTVNDSEAGAAEWKDAVERMLNRCDLPDQPQPETVASKRGGELRNKRKVANHQVQNMFASLEDMEEA